MSRKSSFLADQRGAVALEVPAVLFFLMLIVLLPLADIAVAGFQFISARQALRNFGYSIQYSPPDDVTNVTTTWTNTAVGKADPKYPITNLTVLCGASNTACSSGNNAPPMSYSYSTTVTIAPIWLKALLCTGGTTSGCTFTLRYSERFQ